MPCLPCFPFYFIVVGISIVAEACVASLNRECHLALRCDNVDDVRCGPSRQNPNLICDYPKSIWRFSVKQNELATYIGRMRPSGLSQCIRMLTFDAYNHKHISMVSFLLVSHLWSLYEMVLFVVKVFPLNGSSAISGTTRQSIISGLIGCFGGRRTFCSSLSLSTPVAKCFF